jgi:predicted transcriptional regulator
MYNPKKYKNMTSKLSALKAIIDMANSSNTPQALFPLTSQFSKLTFQDPDFQAPLKKITKEGNKVFATMLKAERDALNELKSHEKTIRKYVTTNNVTNPLVLQSLDAFQVRLKNKTKLNILIIPLEQALYALVNDDTSDQNAITQTFGKIRQINDDKSIDRAAHVFWS